MLRGLLQGEVDLGVGESGGWKVSCSLLSELALSADSIMGIIPTRHPQQNWNSEAVPPELDLDFTSALCH